MLPPAGCSAGCGHTSEECAATPVAPSIPSNASSQSTKRRNLDDSDAGRSIYAGRPSPSVRRIRGSQSRAGYRASNARNTVWESVDPMMWRIDATTGQNTITFTGRLGTDRLTAGRYRLTAIAIDPAGSPSNPAQVTIMDGEAPDRGSHP